MRWRPTGSAVRRIVTSGSFVEGRGFTGSCQLVGHADLAVHRFDRERSPAAPGSAQDMEAFARIQVDDLARPAIE